MTLYVESKSTKQARHCRYIQICYRRSEIIHPRESQLQGLTDNEIYPTRWHQRRFAFGIGTTSSCCNVECLKRKRRYLASGRLFTQTASECGGSNFIDTLRSALTIYGGPSRQIFVGYFRLPVKGNVVFFLKYQNTQRTTKNQFIICWYQQPIGRHNNFIHT